MSIEFVVNITKKQYDVYRKNWKYHLEELGFDTRIIAGTETEVVVCKKNTLNIPAFDEYILGIMRKAYKMDNIKIQVLLEEGSQSNSK